MFDTCGALYILQHGKLKFVTNAKTTETDQGVPIVKERLCFVHPHFPTPFQVIPAWCRPPQNIPAPLLRPHNSSGPCRAPPDVSHTHQVVVPVDRDRQLSTAQRGYVSSLSKGRRASCSLYGGSESRMWRWKRKATLREVLMTDWGKSQILDCVKISKGKKKKMKEVMINNDSHHKWPRTHTHTYPNILDSLLHWLCFFYVECTMISTCILPPFCFVLLKLLSLRNAVSVGMVRSFVHSSL